MICIAASQAGEVFAPLALALFIIALVWPLQSWLQARMPALLALAITMSVTVAVCIAFASLVAWGFGRVGVSLIADSARYQALYETAIDWLERHGISVAGLMERAFQRRLARAVGGPDHGPRQHHPQLLADRPSLRHLG